MPCSSVSVFGGSVCWRRCFDASTRTAP